MTNRLLRQDFREDLRYIRLRLPRRQYSSHYHFLPSLGKASCYQPNHTDGKDGLPDLMKISFGSSLTRTI